LSDKSLYEWIQIYTRLKHTKSEQKRFQSQKHDVKPPAVFQSDEEGDTDFESDSDYVESDQASEKEKTSGKYPFLQIIHFMKLIKPVFLNPKIWCPILQGITA